MNKLIIVGTFLLIAFANVDCLRKNSALDSEKGKLEEVQSPESGTGGDTNSFLEADSDNRLRKKSDSAKNSAILTKLGFGPPPGKSKANSFVENENESTDFESINFYEHYFYSHFYELSNYYKIYSTFSCDSNKQLWLQKELDINVIYSFCNYIGHELDSAYLIYNICPKIINLRDSFSKCSS